MAYFSLGRGSVMGVGFGLEGEAAHPAGEEGGEEEQGQEDGGYEEDVSGHFGSVEDGRRWIPACAGMTEGVAGMRELVERAMGIEPT